jgi:hypothetical protein
MMFEIKKKLTRILMLAVVFIPLARVAITQSGSPEVKPVLVSGTLNLILANRNGFVIAADSRQSSDKAFSCEGKIQTFCDNSQKLFRTGPAAAMVIAGFAVGQSQTPFDIAIASLLRKRFGTQGLSDGRGDPAIASGWAQGALDQSLMGFASLYDPASVSASDLELTVTFAGIDKDGTPTVRQLIFTPTWRPSGPLKVLIPEYHVVVGEQKVTRFLADSEGIKCVADAILGGVYKSHDPIIQSYYLQLRTRVRDNMSLVQMQNLAKAILRETKNFTPLVGGEDQIGVFPVKGDVQWHLPPNLPLQTQLSPSFILVKGVLCTNAEPKCTGGDNGLIFFQDFQHPLDEPPTRFFLSSQFKNIDIAIDNNYFVKNSFEAVTFKWRGGRFPFMRGNSYTECTLELPERKSLPQDSELAGKCIVIKKPDVVVDPATVGASAKMHLPPCVKQLPGGGISITTGGGCENGDASKSHATRP